MWQGGVSLGGDSDDDDMVGHLWRGRIICGDKEATCICEAVVVARQQSGTVHIRVGEWGGVAMGSRPHPQVYACVCLCVCVGGYGCVRGYLFLLAVHGEITNWRVATA